VPYTAPGSRGGFVVVYAASREDAINAAIELHGSRYQDLFSGNPSWGLTARQRAVIDYGEPVLLDAAQIVGGVA
jgi:hypothetical protein